MTEAEGQFIARVTNGENIHKVYKDVFKADTSKANAMIQEPEIKEAIEVRLKADGVTERKLHKTLAKQLNAKKVIYYDPKLSKDVVDDNNAQLDAVKVGYKLLGLLKDKDVYVDNRQVTFSGDIMQLAKIAEEMKALRQRACIDISGEVI